MTFPLFPTTIQAQTPHQRTAPMPKKITSKDHFISLLARSPDFPDCLFLKPRVKTKVISTILFEDKTYTPQRLAWRLAFGEPPPATRITSTCKRLHPEHPCCNPAHLRIVPLSAIGRVETPNRAGRPKGSKNGTGASKAEPTTLNLPPKLPGKYY